MKEKEAESNSSDILSVVKPVRISKHLNHVKRSQALIERLEMADRILAKTGLPKIPGR